MSDAPKKKQSLGDVFTMIGHALNNPEEARAGGRQAAKNALHGFIEKAFEERPKKKVKQK